MKKNPPTTTQQPAPATAAHAAIYWKAVADFIAGVVQMADHYLIDDSNALDEDSKTEIYNALVQARVSADTAHGAYNRASSADRAQAARAATQYVHQQMGHQPQQAPARAYAQHQGW